MSPELADGDGGGGGGGGVGGGAGSLMAGAAGGGALAAGAFLLGGRNASAMLPLKRLCKNPMSVSICGCAYTQGAEIEGEVVACLSALVSRGRPGK